MCVFFIGNCHYSGQYQIERIPVQTDQNLNTDLNQNTPVTPHPAIELLANIGKETIVQQEYYLDEKLFGK